MKDKIGAMIRLRYFFLFIFSLTSLLTAMPPSPLFGATEVLDKVVAVVNDEVITQSELDQFLAPIYDQYKSNNLSQGELASKMNEARQSLLNQLIEDKLVYQEAKRLGVQVTEEEVTARLNEFKEKFKSDDFEKLLVSQGLTISKLRDRYREQLAIQKLHQHEVRSKVIVTPKDIEGYYRSHLDKFSKKESVRARTITIRKSEDPVKKKEEDAMAKASADEILRQLYGGANFEDLAKQYSQDTKAASGGELGIVERGDLVNPIDGVVFNLKPGEISPVLETDMGFHIFKIEEKNEQETKTMEAVRDQIQDLVFREKSHIRFKEWMEELKKNAYISIR